LRRVSTVVGYRAHLDKAAVLPFPLDARLRSSALPEDLQAAIVQAVSLGDGLVSMREAVIARCRSIASQLRPLSAILNREMPPSVRLIAAGVNTAFMAAVIDALQWLDTSLVCSFIHGFRVVGDIPDSGVYRAVEAVDDATFRSTYNSFISSAHAWNRVLHQRLLGRASSTTDAHEADVAVADTSRKERAKGLIIGPYDSPSALHRAIKAVTPIYLLPMQVRLDRKQSRRLRK
jgi:hypothetical protein